jgi:3-oxoacyl-[acyl-carrier protein] reductase
MRNVFITGISRGVGLCLVQMLLKDSDYVIYGISRSCSLELEKLLKRYPDRLKWKACDLEQSSSVEECIFQDFIDLKSVPVHAFVNNAAILYKDLITRIDLDNLNQLININLVSPMLLTKNVIKNFIYHKTPGNIIHLSSICAHRGFSGLSMIGATKGGIESFSITTAKEYGRKGIRSNAVVIGILNIGMSFSVSEKQRDDIFNSTALNDYTDVDSVINTIRYLLSDNARSITGQNIHVNAGVI